jgi:ADP-heptose:LPS heptosyltransferase
MTGTGISVDAMRRIDRLAGIPLCLLATIVLKIWWALRRRRPRPIRRVLFIELSEMGSAVLADPAMRKVRESIGAENYFLIFTQNADSLTITGTIDRRNIFTIGTSSLWRLTADTLAFLVWARRTGIDTVIDLELFSRFTGLLTGLSGADRRIGFYRFRTEGLYRGEMLTHRVAYNPHIHIAKNFIALVDALLSKVPEIPYSKTIIDDEQLTLSVQSPSAAALDKVKAQIEALSGKGDVSRHRLVLINANSSAMLPQRRWMPERYVELIRRILAAQDDALVLLTGAPNERPEAEALAARCADDRCIAFAGHTAFTDLPALYALAAVMVSNDSGPAHFAAACGLPTVVLFGPETPNLYQPLGKSTAIYAGLACSPCVNATNHRNSACTDNVCMRAISIEQVFAAVDRVLSRQISAPA